MRPIGMKVLIQRDKTGEFDLRIPTWIGDQLGDLLFDGLRWFEADYLPAETEPTV